MFWKRAKQEPPTVITALGVFTWDAPFAWACAYQQGSRQLALTYLWHRFDPADLARFEAALSHLDELSRLALAASQQELAEYDHRPEQMVLCGLTVDPKATDEDIQLDFSFQNWPDGCLTVHFKGQEVTGSHIDD